METIEDIAWTLVIVDDGSTDKTEQVMHQLSDADDNIRYLKLTRNFGKEAAITAGIEFVEDADAVILVDGDLQHPLELLPNFIKGWRKGYDMVVAVPMSRKGGFLNRVFSWIFHKFIAQYSTYSITIGGGDFRLLSANQLDYLKGLPERSRYMKGLYNYSGGNILEIEYAEKKRTSGSSSFTFFKRLKLAINGITSTTVVPIRFFSVLGLLILLFAIIYLVYIVVEILLFGRSVPGFASLLFFIIVLNGLIMIQLGVQGEYISQLLIEAKKRPIYIIDEKNSILHDK